MSLHMIPGSAIIHTSPLCKVVLSVIDITLALWINTATPEIFIRIFSVTEITHPIHLFTTCLLSRGTIILITGIVQLDSPNLVNVHFYNHQTHKMFKTER